MVKIPEFKNVEFKNKNIYDLVFTHRSYLNEAPKGIESNERLEFLGDSILSFVVSSYIYEKFPDLKEGELTNLRAALTNTNALYNAASKLELGSYLRLSRGEEASGGRTNKTILADTFEALIGGVFLDQGIEAATNLIETHLLSGISSILKKGLKDPKNVLQEFTQKERKISPVYKVLREEGPDHSKTYTIGVYLEEELLAVGTGNSKQEAEKVAAANALGIIADN